MTKTAKWTSAFAFVICTLAFNSSSGQAASPVDGASKSARSAAFVQTEALSAARKQQKSRKRAHTQDRRAVGNRSYGDHYSTSRHRAHYGGPFSADPSFGYYPTLRRIQASGRCVIDLGYGYFEYCN